MINFIRRLLNIFPEPKEHTYEVCYSVKVKNLFQGENKIAVVLPIPFKTFYQEILSEPTFSFGGQIINEFRFGNSVILWQEILSAGLSMDVSESFKIRVHEREKLINPVFTVKDYEGLKDNLGYWVYIAPGEHLSGNDYRVRGLAKTVVGNEENLKTATKKLYEFVVKRLKYGKPIKGLYTFSDVLIKDKVDCGGFDSLLGSLYMSLGIPARIVSGFWANNSDGETSEKMHAWLEFMLPDGKWFPVDPSIEHLRIQGRTKRQGGFGRVGSDRIAFSYGSDITLEIGGKKQVFDILQNPIVIAERGDDSVEVKTNLTVQEAKL